MENEFEKVFENTMTYHDLCVVFTFSFYNPLSPRFILYYYIENHAPPPSTPTHTHTRTLPVLYHTTPSLHLFITPFRSCKSSKVNFSLNLPRARRRRHCIVVRRCSTRTILYTHKLRLMNERKTDFPGTLRLHHWQPLYLIYIYIYIRIQNIMCI